MILYLLLACTYTVDNYWTDLAQAHCQCSQEGDVANCVNEWEVRYENSEAWASCQNEPSPITRQWAKDYTNQCRLPDTPVLYPDNPDWSSECGS
jgi:hypothetical protein